MNNHFGRYKGTATPMDVDDFISKQYISYFVLLRLQHLLSLSAEQDMILMPERLAFSSRTGIVTWR